MLNKLSEENANIQVPILCAETTCMYEIHFLENESNCQKNSRNYMYKEVEFEENIELYGTEKKIESQNNVYPLMD